MKTIITYLILVLFIFGCKKIDNEINPSKYINESIQEQWQSILDNFKENIPIKPLKKFVGL